MFVLHLILLLCTRSAVVSGSTPAVAFRSIEGMERGKNRGAHVQQRVLLERTVTTTTILLI